MSGRLHRPASAGACWAVWSDSPSLPRDFKGASRAVVLSDKHKRLGRWKGTRMEPRVVTKEAIKRFAVRSTTASALLERRVVPVGFVRSSKVEEFLAERRSKA